MLMIFGIKEKCIILTRDERVQHYLYLYLLNMNYLYLYSDRAGRLTRKWAGFNLEMGRVVLKWAGL